MLVTSTDSHTGTSCASRAQREEIDMQGDGQGAAERFSDGILEMESGSTGYLSEPDGVMGRS